ncbi:MAG: hypothetical protein KF824_13530 [Fimbriimonadaceae bacterium]|nr:MAG: hypothetical protein KF824_13530 [Fimbriimonadaceae bacterium]
MELFLKRLGLDSGSLRLAYLLGREQGRKFVRGALIFPGIRMVDLQRQAAKNREEAQQLIDKRDAMLEAMLNFIEEFVNLDED